MDWLAQWIEDRRAWAALATLRPQDLRSVIEQRPDVAEILEAEAEDGLIHPVIEFLMERMALLEGRIQELEQRESTKLPSGEG